MSADFHHHDHEHDPAGHEAGRGLTTWRRQVLDVLTSEGRSLGAYDIIERIGRSAGRTVAPISVYRALDYLVENRMVHRLASRNAFLACCHRHCSGETVVFLICETCGQVEEATSPAIREALAGVASGAGFSARGETIELSGSCASCRAAA